MYIKYNKLKQKEKPHLHKIIHNGSYQFKGEDPYKNFRLNLNNVTSLSRNLKKIMKDDDIDLNDNFDQMH